MQKSFDSLPFWVTEVTDRAPSDVIIVLVANKVDLPSREVSAEVRVRAFVCVY